MIKLRFLQMPKIKKAVKEFFGWKNYFTAKYCPV
jgi:hypothetical protein